MSAKNSIQVGIKMRPLLPKEKDLISHWTVAGNTISSKQGNQDFRFDFVFDQDVCNQIIFDKMAKHIIHSAVHGFNGTIFAYGQTASGKTYTMMGEENNPGVMVLAAKEIFNEIDKMPNFEFLLRGGFIEIYNEKIYDLLNKSSPDLKIHESANGNAHVNCKETCITTEQQLLDLLEAGNETRTVGETNMNERSSRSHAIFRLIIESRETSSGDDGKVTQSVLNLVDLAGSERADQTGACGKRFKEGAHINKSLLFLSQVISRLSESEDKQFINYRDSKLTRILQASLGGNAFTSIICTVTPTSVEETQSTLCFAMRAKTVKNKPHVNEIVSDSTMMKRLTREIQDLKKELEQERRKNTSQLKVNEIERRLGFTEHKFINSISIKNSRTNKTHRRRTWCAEGDNKQSDSPIACEMAESIMKPATAKPIMPLTPLITMRENTEHKFELPSELGVLEEEFEPATNFNFGEYRANRESTKYREEYMRLSLSPNIKNTSTHVRILEEQLASLQEFANLEKEVGVEHNMYDNIKKKLDAVSKRNEQLESERIEYLTAQSEIDLLREHLNFSENRCDILQVEVARLQSDKHTSDKKIEDYESELSQLKETIQSLEIENRNAVSLQFEFETHRKKSKLREQELLELLAEKDQHLVGLENQIKSLPAANRLNLSVENVMQLVSGGGDVGESHVNGNPFELRSKEGDDDDHYNNFEKQQELKQEISKLRLKLSSIERDNEELKCDRDAKLENSKVLWREITELQTKYKNLESDWKKQSETITAITYDYNVLEEKYNELKKTYENLESDSTRCTTDCQRLQSENDGLQNEIQNLISRVQEMQLELLNEAAAAAAAAKENGYPEDYLQLCAENDRLLKELKDLQSQYESLQQENEQLSNNVMETLQENDTLTASYERLNAERIEWQSERAGLQEKISELKQRLLLKPSVNDDGHVDEDLHKNGNIFTNDQRKNLQYVQIIELANEDGGAAYRRKYISMDAGIKSETVTQYKLLLDKWQSNENNKNETSVQLGAFDEAIIKTIDNNEMELIEQKLNAEKIKQCLQESNENLKDQVQDLEIKYNALLESSGRDVEDLREEIQRLTRELFEKSMVIEEIVKERTERTLYGEDLQTSKSTMMRTNRTFTPDSLECCDMNDAFADYDRDESKKSHDDTLKIMKNELQNKEEELSQMKLEMLEKLESAEARFRCNLRKYNSEWQANRLKYKHRIEELENMLAKEGIEIEKKEISGYSIDDVNENSIISEQVIEANDENCSRKLIKEEMTELADDLLQTSFNRVEKSSTPNTPSRAKVSPERYSHVQKAREERTLMVQECNAQISKLCVAIADAKETNAQLTQDLAERDEELRMKNTEIENLKAADEGRNTVIATLNATIEMAKKQVLKLEKNIKILEFQLEERNIEIVNLKANTEKIVRVKNDEIEKHLTNLIKEQEDLKNERSNRAELDTKMKTLQTELDSFLKESDDRLIEENEKVSKLQERLDIELSEKQNLQRQLDEMKRAKIEIESELKALNIENSDKIKMNEMLQKELDHLKRQQLENAQLIEKLKEEVIDLSAADGERSRLQSKLIMLKSEFANKEKLFETEKSDLMDQLEESRRIRIELEVKLKTFALKIESLSQEFHESKLNAARLERTLQEFKEMENQYESVLQEKKNLQSELSKLQAQLIHTTEVDTLRKQLKDLQIKHSFAKEQEETLSNGITSLRVQLYEEQKQSRRENQELQSQLKELKYQYEQLQQKNEDLIAQNKQMEERLKSSHSSVAAELKKLHEVVANLREEKRTLESQLEKKSNEIENHAASFQMKLKEQTTAYANLRTALAAKEAVKSKLENTVTTLQSENKNLSERLEKLNELMRKRTETCDSANSSLETSAHSQNSPLARRSCGMANAEDKFTSMQKERRNRRLSTHDENRRQSAKFIIHADASTMTESRANECQCEELKEKLKEIETQLYIRESQVKALNMELRHHPLKEEKIKLTKRVQEEQEKNRTDARKYKAKIAEQTAKIQELVEQANKTSAMNAPIPIVKLHQGTCTSPLTKNSLREIDTQTDMDIDQCLQKLQTKYNDLKNICRFRYNTIKQLQQQLEEKENILRVQSPLASSSSNQQQQQQQQQQQFQQISGDKRK